MELSYDRREKLITEKWKNALVKHRSWQHNASFLCRGNNVKHVMHTDVPTVNVIRFRLLRDSSRTLRDLETAPQRGAMSKWSKNFETVPGFVREV
jgi:hypothetical protein